MTETNPVNEQLVLISGESAGGKSASLRNIENQERWAYLNAEAGKRLPFKNKFKTGIITDPWAVMDYFDHIIDNPDQWDGLIIDTLTFLMDMFESLYVVGSSNTMAAWANYNQYFKSLMQKKVATIGKPVLILAHTKSELHEAKQEMQVFVPIKGSLKNQGIEAYFSTVVSAKRVTIRELEKYNSDLLTITDEDRELGYKHVFQTQPTKATVGERIRSPMGMFTRNQTYMDNDANLLLKHLREFYSH